MQLHLKKKPRMCIYGKTLYVTETVTCTTINTLQLSSNCVIKKVHTSAISTSLMTYVDLQQTSIYLID